MVAGLSRLLVGNARKKARALYEESVNLLDSHWKNRGHKQKRLRVTGPGTPITTARNNQKTLEFKGFQGFGATSSTATTFHAGDDVADCGLRQINLDPAGPPHERGM